MPKTAPCVAACLLTLVAAACGEGPSPDHAPVASSTAISWPDLSDLGGGGFSLPKIPLPRFPRGGDRTTPTPSTPVPPASNPEPPASTAPTPKPPTSTPTAPKAGTASCDPNTWDASATAMEDEVLRLVNARRGQPASCAGTHFDPAPALTAQVKLRAAARKHACDMALHHYFDHTAPDGSTPWQRIDAEGYTYSAAAENIAAGAADAKAVVDMWMSDYGHCANIMNPNVTELGTGYYAPAASVGAPYRTYWVQDFGHPR